MTANVLLEAGHALGVLSGEDGCQTYETSESVTPGTPKLWFCPEDYSQKALCDITFLLTVRSVCFWAARWQGKGNSVGPGSAGQPENKGPSS